MQQAKAQRMKKLFLLIISIALLAAGAVYFALSKINTTDAKAADDYAYAGTLKITKNYYESFESSNLLPINQVYAGDDILYVLKVTNISSNPESRFGSTINIDDELSPDVMGDVHVEDIIINTTWMTRSQIDGACGVNNSYVLHCSLSADMFSANELYPNPNNSAEGDSIQIRIKAKAAVHQKQSKSYQLHNRAYVYSGDDVDNDGPDCKTLADARQVSRCRSEDVVFCVVMPAIEVDKIVNKSGRVTCYYYANKNNADKAREVGFNLKVDNNDETNLSIKRDKDTNELTFPSGTLNDKTINLIDLVTKKDITEETGSYESNCMNNDGGAVNYTYEDADAIWDEKKDTSEFIAKYIMPATEEHANDSPKPSDAEIEAYAKNKFVKEIVGTLNYTDSATNGFIDDQSVRAGERIEYTITVRNMGSAVTKGGETDGIYIYDQLDPQFFENNDIYVQPLTGGVTCSVEQSKLTCYANRPLAPYDLEGLTANSKYTKEEANVLYNNLEQDKRQEWLDKALKEQDVSEFCSLETTNESDCVAMIEKRSRELYIAYMVTLYKPNTVTLPDEGDCKDFCEENPDWSGYYMNGQYGLGKLPVNDEIKIRVTAIPKNTGEIKNIAYVGGGGDLLCPNNDTNSYCHSEWVSTFISAPELHINKELRNGTDADMGTSIVRGTEAKYVIKVTNEGTADTKGMLVIHDVIPDYLEVNRTTLSLSFDDASYSYESGFCEFRGTTSHELYCRAYDTIEGGLFHRSGVWTIEFNVKVLEDAEINEKNNKVVNYAYVYGGEDPVCNTDEILLTIKQAFNSGDINPYDRCYDYLGHSIVSPKLKVTKGVDKSPTSNGEKFNYWVTVENKGDYVTTADTTVLDYLPDNITVATKTLSQSCEYDGEGGTISCNIAAGMKPGGKQTFKFSAISTNLSGQVVNEAVIFNEDDSDCSNDAAALNTSRCHASVSTMAQSPLLKIETSASALEVYKGGQVAYLTTVRNIGNAQTTADTTVTIQTPAELKLLGVRTSNGTCRIDLHYYECTIPAGLQPGEAIYISTLAQATTVTEADTTLSSSAYGGGDPDCTELAEDEETSRVFGNKVFAADTVSTGGDGDSATDITDPKTEGDASKTDESTSDTSETDDSVKISPEATAPETTTNGQTVTPAEPDTSTKKRCKSQASIRIIDMPTWVADIDGSNTGAPSAGILSTMQVLGTISMLGVASYMVLKSRKDFVAKEIA